MEYWTVIGIDIGGTKVAAALFDQQGTVLKKSNSLLKGRKGVEVIDLVADTVKYLSGFAEGNNLEIKGIGVSVPGIYDPVQKTAWAPNIPEWDHIPLWDELMVRLDEPTFLLEIESDRSCYILGELWKGSAQGCTDVVFLAVGTGIGAGILSNGHLISGKNGIAGAVGWMALEPPFRDEYINWGNFEHYASGNGIARAAVEILTARGEYSGDLANIPKSEIRAEDVFSAYEKDDPVAIETLNKAIAYWGMAIANLVSIFNSEKIIIGGGVFGPAVQFLDKIRAESGKWGQPLSMKKVSFESSALGGDAGMIGAGYLAVRSLNE